VARVTPLPVSIVLTPPLASPVGGYLVQYELADHLAAMGHRPIIVHPLGGRPELGALPRTAARYYRARRHQERLVPWHDFDPAVRLHLVPWLSGSWLPRADLTVLTAYQTSAAVGHRTGRTGPLAQIVYDYEFWAGGDSDLRSAITASLGRPDVAHIATSKAVRDMLEQIGAPVAATVPPGIADRFHVQVPAHKRQVSIGFAYRSEPHKGIPDLVAALERVHAAHPFVAVRCFGRADDPPVPRWVERRGVLTDADLVRFYNECAIFVLPSHYEGWGLPAAEAMACGAALVVTACGGTADFTGDGHNALVVSPGDPEGLAHAITRLIEDRELRNRLATTGAEETRDRRWPQTAATLHRVFRQVIDDDRATRHRVPSLPSHL
jgi:glycosyltransferase involved in cell wall biosynthesis